MANTKITNPELFNLGDSTLATQLPVMTTTQRIAMNAPPTLTVDYLVVAGGGGGGNSQGASGSGGGAGEYLYQTGQSLTTGGSGYTVTVGAGGSGGTGSSYPSANGLSGSDSFFVRSVAGGGAGLFSSPGNLLQSVPGGSGGGARPGSGSGAASTAFAPGVGNAGGSSSGNGGGGGGGAGSPGTTGTTSLSGSGGNGLQNSITGVSTYYAGGGAGGNFAPTGGSIGSGGSGIGGTSSYTGTAGSGVNNTGSGGAGGSYANSTSPYISYAGGDGGSGVVILRYATADIASYTTTGITPTEDTTTIPGQTILSFTTVGTGTIIFTSPTPTGTISTGEMIFNSTTDKVEYWDGTKWYGITYEAQDVQLTFNEMWYSVDSPYTCASNRGTITNAIADFNTYTEGQADYNTNPKTSGKWYIEILQRQSTGHNGYTVFQKSGNTTYNTAPYVATNPVDGNYGLTLYANGNICYYGDGSTLTALSPTPNLGISNNQVACIAVDVDNQKVWFGKKTSATATSVTWVSGTNPATNTGGYSVGFTEFDPMVSHASETSSRESEFGLVDVANFATPSGFSNWQGNISSSLTVNCSQH
jgi:hypothetical protein